VTGARRLTIVAETRWSLAPPGPAWALTNVARLLAQEPTSVRTPVLVVGASCEWTVPIAAW
jgi:hypothetical protein